MKRFEFSPTCNALMGFPMVSRGSLPFVVTAGAEAAFFEDLPDSVIRVDLLKGMP